MKKASIFLVILTTLFFSCTKGEDIDKKFDGSKSAIVDFLGERAYDSIVKLGITFNTGNTPPDITGSYLVSPHILKKSLIPADRNYIGTKFNDHTLEFKNFNLKELTIDYIGNHTSSLTGTGDGVYISGSDNKFTIVLKVTMVRKEKDEEDMEAKTTFVISGELDSDSKAILNYHNAFLMLDNEGNSPPLIENFQGRLVYDKDGVSPEAIMPSKRTSTSNNKGLFSILSQ